MNRFLLSLTVLVLALSLAADAASERSASIPVLKQIDSNSAQAMMMGSGGGQAANFVDGKQTSEFLDLMLRDPKSLVSRLKAQIENDNPCDARPVCGVVTIQGSVRNSFARGGWMQARASTVFLVGFTEPGTGHEFHAIDELVIDEEVAVVDPQKMNFKKTLSFEGARDIRQDALNIK